MRASVLIPSFSRPPALLRCLASLAAQTQKADEIIVVWQGDDSATRDAALTMTAQFGGSLRVIHLQHPGIVPAENAALAVATGEIILLIDDDAVAPTDWLETHLAIYADPSVGAVGGPANNFNPDGSQFPVHPAEPCGKLTFYGKAIGNLYDQPPAWKSRSPAVVDHLVGYNMSLRRVAFDRFEERLRRYWQVFELDACLQVKSRGYRVLFDFANIVEHHPTNTAYVPGRGGDLQIKIFNSSFNNAFVMAKHAPWHRWPAIFFYAIFVGGTNAPGVAASIRSAVQLGRPGLEARILLKSIVSRLAGFRDGLRARSSR